MKLSEINPRDFIARCKVPVMFVHGIDDELIEMSHSEKLLSAYGGETKDVQYVPGGHNDERPQETLEYAANYAKKYLF